MFLKRIRKMLADLGAVEQAVKSSLIRELQPAIVVTRPRLNLFLVHHLTRVLSPLKLETCWLLFVV